VLEQSQQAGDVEKALDLGFEPADLVALPVEEVTADGVPGGAIVKAQRVGGGKGHLGDEQLGRLDVVAADLVDAEGDALVFVGVLALDDQDGDTVEEKDDGLAVAIAAIVPVELFGDLVEVAGGVVIVDEDKVELAALGGAKELAAIAQ